MTAEASVVVVAIPAATLTALIDVVASIRCEDHGPALARCQTTPVHTMLGVPRLAVILRRPASRNRQACP
jgi:hypothetical protein